MHLPIGYCTRLAKRSEEQVRVLAVAEHRFGVVAMVHDVVNSPRALDANFASHRQRSSRSGGPIQAGEANFQDGE
jgi:hypothetical protein